MFDWLKFWKKAEAKKPVSTPVIVIPKTEIEIEQDTIVDLWDSQFIFGNYYGDSNIENLVNLFKIKLRKEFGFTYFLSGGSSNVFLDKRKLYVVKLAQVMGQPAPYDCYRNLKNKIIPAPAFEVPSDVNNWLEIQKIYREHVCCPHKIAKNNLLCIQKYFPQDCHSKSKIMTYFDSLLGNYQIQQWRRATSWRDIGVINNMVWDSENSKAWIIDIH